MRKPRIKPADATWHHITTRAAGSPKDRLFGDKERNKLLEILKEHTVYYPSPKGGYLGLGGVGGEKFFAMGKARDGSRP